MELLAGRGTSLCSASWGDRKKTEREGNPGYPGSAPCELRSRRVSWPLGPATLSPSLGAAIPCLMIFPSAQGRQWPFYSLGSLRPPPDPIEAKRRPLYALKSNYFRCGSNTCPSCPAPPRAPALQLFSTSATPANNLPSRPGHVRKCFPVRTAHSCVPGLRLS